MENGVQLADSNGEGELVITNEEIRFNGKSKCGHRKDEEVTIPWPATPKSGDIANNWKEDPKAGHWFAGVLLEKRTCDGDCSYESVNFRRNTSKEEFKQANERGLLFGCCKTAFRPYDLAVQCLLVIARYHLGKDIEVSSDGEKENWAEAVTLCQEMLGYGLMFELEEVRIK